VINATKTRLQFAFSPHPGIPAAAAYAVFDRLGVG
jgi:hypothetical protein